MTFLAVAQVAVCVGFPALAIAAAERNRLAKAVGPVVLCYGAGLVLANLPGLMLEKAVSLSVAEGAVPLAIPLLLFSTDVRKWVGLAKGALVSFGLACLSAVMAAGVVSVAFRARVDEWWQVAGMLVGVYVGGTANMSAIGLALGTRSETFVLLNAADVLCGGVYLLFLLSLAPRLLARFLRPFTQEAHHEAFEHPGEKLSAWTRAHALPMGLSFLLAAAIVGLSVGAAVLLLGKLDPGPVLLGITTLALAASFSSRVRGLQGSFELGEYVLLIFCVAVGSLADVRQLGGGSAVLLLFVAAVLLVASTLHFALCRLFRIDLDTAVISSTAAIFGPPFIGPVAAALKNRALVGPGLTLGLAGLALGTYFGLGTAYALRALFGG
ncbi:MAG: DUF819 family protein [Myxococcota bacterium]